jgi:hypothetical protein
MFNDAGAPILNDSSLERDEIQTGTVKIARVKCIHFFYIRLKRNVNPVRFAL